jgi:hypothetical protein
MNVVLYSDGVGNLESSRLQEALKPVVAKQSLEIFSKFEDFLNRVRRLPRDIDVAVLMVKDDKGLTALLSLSDYLDATRIILMLQDRDPGMTSKAHLLHPRFLAYSDDDFSDIAAVLSKMLRNKNPFRSVRN